MRATCTPNFSASRAAASHSVHSCDMKMDCGALSSSSSRSSQDRKSTRLNSSHITTSYAVFCLKKNKRGSTPPRRPSSDSTRRQGPGRRPADGLCAPNPSFFFNDTATTEIYTLSLPTLFRSCLRIGWLFAHGPLQRRARERLMARELLDRSEEHTSELQSHHDLVCRLLLE